MEAVLENNVYDVELLLGAGALVTQIVCPELMQHDSSMVARLVLDPRPDAIVETVTQSARCLLADRVVGQHAGENMLTFAIALRAPRAILEALIREATIRSPRLLNDNDQKGDTPVALAASLGDVAALELLRKAGASIGLCNRRNRTPLMMAARHGQFMAVQYLIRNGILSITSDSALDKAIELSALCGHLDVFHLLIERKDRRQKHCPVTKDVSVVLQAALNAAVERSSHKFIVGLLDRHACRVDLNGALACAARAGTSLAVIQELLARGASTWWRGDDQRYPHELAVDVDAYDLLLQVHLADDRSNHWDPARMENEFLHAVTMGSMHFAQHFLNQCIKADSADTNGVTALMLASSRSNKPMMRLLLEHGATLAVEDGYRRNVMQRLARGSDRGKALATFEFLADTCLARTPRIPPEDCSLLLETAVKMQSHVVVTRLITEDRLDRSLRGDRAFALLMHVLRKGDSVLLRRLLSNSVAAARFLHPYTGSVELALRRAARKPTPDCFNILIAAIGHAGVAPAILRERLTLAITTGSTLGCRIMFEHAVDPDTVDAAGNTALMSAFETNKYGILGMLLDRGANIRIPNREGKHLLPLAMRRGDFVALTLMLEKCRQPFPPSMIVKLLYWAAGRTDAGLIQSGFLHQAWTLGMIDTQADLEGQNCTAAMLALQHNDTTALRTLLENNASPFAGDINLADVAIRESRLSCLEVLCTHAPDAFSPIVLRYRPFDLSAFTRKLFSKPPGDLDGARIRDLTALFNYALQFENVVVAALLLRAGFSVSVANSRRRGTYVESIARQYEFGPSPSGTARDSPRQRIYDSLVASSPRLHKEEYLQYQFLLHSNGVSI
jgi:ankyrin repeat protein